ncbi:MAG: type II toxin-antitoxin system RelE/ParE family toxin [Gemmataceae bacterium]|nr:type II toxin-antitoxin system RelE/ParE family toxin [Gemmataceae bacterium]
MVEWKPPTLDRLAELYVAEPDPAAREAMARCVEAINRRLAADPWSPGESRGPNRRVWFHPPLLVIYDLPPGGGVVVIHVNRTKGDPPA